MGALHLTRLVHATYSVVYRSAPYFPVDAHTLRACLFQLRPIITRITRTAFSLQACALVRGESQANLDLDRHTYGETGAQ